MRLILVVAAIALTIAPGGCALAVALETLAAELGAVRALAVRTEKGESQYEIFFAEPSRVAKIAPGAPSKPSDVVTGFSSSDSGEPRALLFLDQKHLVVGCRPDAAIRVYELPATGKPLDAAATAQKVDKGAPGNIALVARTRANDRVSDSLVAVFTPPDNEATLLRIPVRAGVLGRMDDFASQGATELGGPVRAIALSPQGYVVTGQAADSASQLVFYNPIDGTIALRMQVPLGSMEGLAYSPTSGNLYALGHKSGDKSSTGVYRIEDTSRPAKPSCRAVEVVAIEAPTSLVFGPDGVLYVSSFGEADAGERKAGRISKISGAL